MRRALCRGSNALRICGSRTASRLVQRRIRLPHHRQAQELRNRSPRRPHQWTQETGGANRKDAAAHKSGCPGGLKPGVCTRAEPRHQPYEGKTDRTDAICPTCARQHKMRDHGSLCSGTGGTLPIRPRLLISKDRLNGKSCRGTDRSFAQLTRLLRIGQRILVLAFLRIRQMACMPSFERSRSRSRAS